MIDSQQLVTLLLMNTLGMGILCEAFHTASYIYKSYQGNQFINKRDVNEAYAFVQGTGLDILIQSYHLSYDAEQLRNGFNYYMKRVST